MRWTPQQRIIRSAKIFIHIYNTTRWEQWELKPLISHNLILQARRLVFHRFMVNMCSLISGQAGAVRAVQKTLTWLKILTSSKRKISRFWEYLSTDPVEKIIGWRPSIKIILHGPTSVICNSGTMQLPNYIVSTAFPSTCLLIPQERSLQKTFAVKCFIPNCVRCLDAIKVNGQW